MVLCIDRYCEIHNASKPNVSIKKNDAEILEGFLEVPKLWVSYSRVFSCSSTPTGQGWLDGGQSRKGNPPSYTCNRSYGFLENISSRSRGGLLRHDTRGLLLRAETFYRRSREEGEETNLWCNLHFPVVDSILCPGELQRKQSDRSWPLFVESADFLESWWWFSFRVGDLAVQCHVNKQSWIHSIKLTSLL